MRIDKIYVENFGTLHAYSLDLSSGVNCVFEDNGFGKTTLAVFIKALFYGMGASRGKLEDNERKKYMPWQGGAFGGNIEFSVGEKRYRIERFFGAKESEDTFALYDLVTNTLSRDYSESIGKELFGVSAQGYERSTYFSSRTLKSKDDGSILDKLHSMLEDSGEDESFELAIGMLQEQKKKLRADRGEGGIISELERRVFENRKEDDTLLELEASLKESQVKESQLVMEILRIDSEIARNEKELGIARAHRERAMARRGLSELEAQSKDVDQRLWEYNEFFSKRDTDASEISSLYELEGKFRIARHDVISSRLGESEQRELSALSEIFAKKGIDDKTVNAWSSKFNDYERERALLENESARINEAPRYADVFANGVPSKDELSNMHALADEIASRESSVAKSEKGSDAKARGILVSTGITVGAVGVLVGVLALLGVIQMALVGIGAACVAASIACFAACVLRSKSTDAETLESKNLALSKQKLARFLADYRIEGNPYDALVRLELYAQAYSEELDKKSAEKKRILLAAEQLDAQRKQISEFVAECGKNAAGDLGEQLSEIAQSYTRYDTLAKKQAALEEKRSLRLADKEALEAQLDAYVDAYFGENSEFSYVEALRIVEERLAQRRDLSKRLSDLADQIEKYKSQNGELLLSDGEETVADADELSARIESLRAERSATDARLVSEREKIERLSDAPENLIAVRAKGERLEEELCEARSRCDAIEKAMELMKKAKDNLSSRYIGKMQDAFGEYARSCGFGEEIEFSVDSELDVKVKEHGKSRETDYYSRGMREMIELCARLSLIGVMFEGEEPFLVLDDPFANLDDKNFALVSRLVRSVAEKYQIIYTYCHSSRKI